MATTKKERRQFVASDKWEAYINKKYPGLLEVYRTQPDFADLIRKGYIQNRPAAEIVADVQNTKWYLGLGAGEYEYIVKTNTGDQAYKNVISQREADVKAQAQSAGYTLADDAIKQIAADSLKNRWESSQISKAVNSSVAQTAKKEPTIAEPTAPTATPTTLQMGKDAASIRAAAKSYGLPLTTNQVEGYVQSLLTGSLTTQQVVDQFRNQAKTLYPSIATQLDSGDLDNSVSSYRTIAAQVLGTDPTAIDMTKPQFQKLLTYTDPNSGEHRLMNSTEWNQYLRTLPEWKKTAEASNRYQSLIDTVDKVFGKVR